MRTWTEFNNGQWGHMLPPSPGLLVVCQLRLGRALMRRNSQHGVVCQELIAASLAGGLGCRLWSCGKVAEAEFISNYH